MCIIEMTSEGCHSAKAPHYFEIDPPCTRAAVGGQIRCPDLEVIVTHGERGRQYTCLYKKYPVCCECTWLPIEELRAVLGNGKLPGDTTWI